MQSDGGRSGFKTKSSALRWAKRTVSASGFTGKMVEKRTRDATFKRVEKSPLLKTIEKNARRPPGVAIVAAAPADKSSTIDDELVGGNDEPLETYEPTWTVENYMRLLRESLMKECKSHLNDSCRDAMAQSMTSTSALEKDAVAELVKRATNAIQAKKIFSIHGYYPIIAEELKKRGWVEKRNPNFKPLNYEYLFTTLTLTNSRSTCNVKSPPSLTSTTVESLIIENIENSYLWLIIKDISPNFIFTTNRYDINCNKINDVTIFSQLNNLSFCSKVELAGTVKAISKNVSIKFPRTYNISDTRTMDFFIKDYRFTALLGSLKNILMSKNSQKTMFSENGTIPYEMIDFIEQRCWEFVHAYQTEEESDMLWFTTILEDCWNKFMVWYYEIIEELSTIRVCNTFQINDIYERFDGLERKIKTFCPQFFIDGDTNLWIVKPSNRCSGIGITLERRLNNILKTIKEPNKLNKTYIIQKYIEKPLLIFNVKVDLRQYVLVTNTYPMQIWMYKEGYVRFCSKKFTVQDLCEEVHLSNVRVQSINRKYRVHGVPEECMWDFAQFKEYLKSIEKGDKWHTSIYPTICETISTILIKSFKQNIGKTFAFQLFGADFILTEHFEPWLIEINSNPGLNPTTSIIARIATMLLKDIIKVTVDFPLNSNAETGLFENIYSDTLVKHCNAEKNITKEYYYYQSPKKTKQLNKQSHKGIEQNKKKIAR
ncbi:tubulin glycylase 3A-like isoform X1 [Aphis gossypii]|uniref:tubulin glycylase 3A-like isoform X1 n=1 Tax=Aphis gossypii TaxID=80765 RepID=UPI002158A82B|nr:tubulin glycylase 3A-like isoform X1 [Aphis gossypii]XP_050059071.1 tubulin glycylase 3A-like isoform X1 [Aphis gossypii]XP_050059072.1 tubulin glycylase 3A-like isoform X1 [Aphis gossypii]XP_050059073.1 tubulin glycylase 3A-like isoform X1 [Aphis gossypii]XP_050059074.1 tubulin glycylase 3A-like isoform X1 [Aphis gossypii]XP_050059075.1 tubulin glycylase 3A-like isoform X1 [Aphis gossypii]